MKCCKRPLWLICYEDMYGPYTPVLVTKGLVALERSVTCQRGITGRNRGYTPHPRLTRFQQLEDPVAAIDYYLSIVYGEAIERGYRFPEEKVNWRTGGELLRVFRAAGLWNGPFTRQAGLIGTGSDTMS